MKKVALAVVLGVFLMAGTAVAQSFNITAPADGIHLKRGTTCTIQWTHGLFFDQHPEQNGVLYWGSNPIGTAPIKNDQFVWTVGRKADGSWLPPGTYEITMEALDYDDTSGPNVTIYLLDFKPGVLARRFELQKIPDCPACFSFDLKQVDLEMEGMEFVRVELLHNGKRLADLGRFGRRGAFDAGPVKVQFENGTLRSPGAFELVVLSSSGKPLLREKITMALGR